MDTLTTTQSMEDYGPPGILYCGLCLNRGIIVRNNPESMEEKIMSVATVTSKGQVTIPVEIRQLLHLKPGDKIDFQVDEGGVAKLFPISRRVADVFGILEVEGQAAIPASEIDERLAKALKERYR